MWSASSRRAERRGTNESFLYNRKLMAELSGRPLLDNALDEHLFVGRTELVDQALRAVRQGVNVLLLGPRGSGKTSTLHRLAHLLRQRNVLTVLVDGRAAEDTGDLLGLLAWRLGVTELTRPPRGETERLLALLESVEGRLRDIGKGTVVRSHRRAGQPADAHRLFGRLRDDLWRLPITWVVSVDETDRAAYLKPPRTPSCPPRLEALDDETSQALLQQRVPELEEGTTAMLAPQGGGNREP